MVLNDSSAPTKGPNEEDEMQDKTALHIPRPHSLEIQEMLHGADDTGGANQVCFIQHRRRILHH